MAETNYLRYGDCICLSTSQGFLSSQGFTKTNCFTQVTSVKTPIFQRNVRDFVFQVVPKMNYDAFREYDKFKKVLEKSGGSASQSDKMKMGNLTKKLQEEISINKKVFDRRMGETVNYGEEVQLLHYDSKSFIEGSKSCAEIDKSCNQIKLNPQGSKWVYFYVKPRYKYRNESQGVNYGDVVIFTSSKGNQHLHISMSEPQKAQEISKDDIIEKAPIKDFKNVVYQYYDKRSLPSEWTSLYEVNTNSKWSNFAIRPFRSWSDDRDEQTIKGGQVVKFQHSESGGFISSDDNDFQGENLAEVFLWNYKGKSTDVEALSTQTFFEIEIIENIDSGLGQKCQYSGNSSNETAKSGGMHFRLRHLNTGRLIVMKEHHTGDSQKVYTLGLSEHPRANPQEIGPDRGPKKTTLEFTDEEKELCEQVEKNSEFRLVSTGVDMGSGITNNTSVQIQHVESKRFLKYARDFQLNPKETDETSNAEDAGQSNKNQDETNNKQAEKELLQVPPPEELDSRFQKADDQALNFGQREMLTLEEHASFENAFFVSLERKENIMKVLFVHTSVNCLNDLLKEIANKDYGQSKERQHKIESILKEMIIWLKTDEEGDLDENQGRYIMDTPYSLKSNDEFARKKNNLQVKQKCMRELRVIECLVDILYVPFACGAFDFRALKQEDAIISIMKLCYELLSEIVKDYRPNEIYASQWMGLFLDHVLQANDDNAVGADNFITSLCDENEVILTEMINKKLLEKFVEETDKGKEAPRLLSLLTALCAIQSGPIKQNQRDVVDILVDDEEARKKLLMPLRRIKKSKPIEVCLDYERQHWLPLQKVCEKERTISIAMESNYQKLKAADDEMTRNLCDNEYYAKHPADEQFMIEYQCFVQTLDLFAETCLERNKENQKKLAPLFENKVLIAIFQDPSMNYMIRSRSLRLYLESCLDIDPFHKLQVPSGQVVWKDLCQLPFTGQDLIQAVSNKQIEFTIKQSKTRIPSKILDLIKFMEDFLRSTNGVINPDEKEKNDMIISVLKCVKFMILHGFYKSIEELSSIAQPVIELLNGGKSVKKIKKVVDEEEDPEYEQVIGRSRYFPESPNEYQVQSKCLAADILLQISNLECDAKCNVYLAKLKKDIELMQQQQEVSLTNTALAQEMANFAKNQVAPVEDKPVISSEAQDLELLSEISLVKGFESYEEQKYICVLFDLMLYRYSEIQSKAFAMLVNYFTRKRIMIECLSQTQILESSKSTQILNEIKQSHKVLKKQYSEIQFWLTKHNQAGKDAKNEVARIFEKLARYCTETEAKSDDPELQAEFERDANHSRTMVDISAMNASQTLKRKQTQVTDQRAQQIQDRKNKLEEFLIFHIDNCNATPNRENQRLLQSFDIADIALLIIKMRVDRQTNYNPEYKQLITSCYRFLCAFVRGNFQNQLKVYDDVDVFMRDMDTYHAATLLFYEIFKDNRKFLTLNVTKFIRTINNTAEEVSLNQIKKAIYLKLLETFCRYEGKLIRSNQTEIILQMTADISRSNVLYLFQAEGAKELNTFIQKSQELKRPGASQSYDNLDQTQQNDHSMNEKSRNDISTTSNIRKQFQEQSTINGVSVMEKQIFNVIQLLQLVTLCCQGRKVDVAETKCKESILNFKAAVHIIKMSDQFWPLKIAVFEYIINSYMDSPDPTFMGKPTVDDQADEEEMAENAVDESDTGLLLQLINYLIKDYDAYINKEFSPAKLQMPNGKQIPMKQLQEHYIYHTSFDFIKATLKRKTYDVGSVELKFYELAARVAKLFYEAQETDLQIAALKLVQYIHQTERHQKYLDNIRHPAKKGRQNKEIVELLTKTHQEQNLQIQNQPPQAEMTNSNRLFQRITQLSYSTKMRQLKEEEFTELVMWVSNIGQNVKRIMGTDASKFVNVNYTNFLGALLRLLDAKVLTKEQQIAGLSILRKIIEMENKESHMPSADWNTEDWVQYRRIIKIKQDSLIECGTIQFLCKQISENEDADIQEECILVCISLILGGNQEAQRTFLSYMMEEDSADNKFMLTIKQMLMQNFELTKKYMIEKNAKLEMVHKMKQRQQQKLQTRPSEIARKKQKRRPSQQQVQQNVAEGAAGEVEMADLNQPVEMVEEESSDDDNLMGLNIDDDESQEQGNEDEGDKPISAEELEENTKKRYLTMVIRILRFLQLLCEGHYDKLQNNLREQVNTAGQKCARSFDFVAYVSSIFTVYVKSYVNMYSTNLGNQIIETLVEFIQGPCRESQRTLVETKTIDCCRDLLNQGMGNEAELLAKGFGGKRKTLLNDLKMNSVKLLLSILEGPVDPDISSRISASLGDFQVVINRMESVYYQFLDEELKLDKEASENKVKKSLKKDSFDSCILEGFDIFSLLMQLVEVNPEDREKLEKFNNQPFFKFYVNNSGNIEVTTEFDVLRLYFPLQPKCSFLTQKTKDKFALEVERESGQHKLIGLCAMIPSFIEEMEHLEVMSHQTIQITPHRLNLLKDLSTLLAVIIGAVIITGYKYTYTETENGDFIYDATINNIPDQIIFGVGCVQAVTSFMLVVGFMVNSANLIVKAGWRERVSVNEVEMVVEKRELRNLRQQQFSELDVNQLEISARRMILQIEGPQSSVFYSEITRKRNFGGLSLTLEYYWICLTFLISNGTFIFNIMYFVFSIQGLLQSPVFYSFHLLDVINRFQTLQNVIKAVTLNANQMLMTAMLGAIIIYNYSIFAFLFLADNYFDSTINKGLINKAGTSVCMSLIHCYFSTLNYGLRLGGGIGEFMTTTMEEWNRSNFIIKFFFDLSYFLIITTIILNVVFGIIIDSFAQLREQAQFVQDDIKNFCFMCNLDRYILDRDTDDGFDDHIERDHNLWNYVYFMIHLKQKDTSDYNGTESYINELLTKDEMTWFPFNKSIRMSQTLKLRKREDNKTEEKTEIDLLQEEMQKFDDALTKFENMKD